MHVVWTHLLASFNWKSSLCFLKTRDNARSQQTSSSGSKLFDWNKTAWLDWVKAKLEPTTSSRHGGRYRSTPRGWQFWNGSVPFLCGHKEALIHQLSPQPNYIWDNPELWLHARTTWDWYTCGTGGGYSRKISMAFQWSMRFHQPALDRLCLL